MRRLFPRRFIVSSVICASILGFAAPPAAAEKPDRGCPNDKYLLLPAVDPTDFLVDLNDDGLVCVAPIPGPPEDPQHFNVIDNTSNSDH